MPCTVQIAAVAVTPSLGTGHLMTLRFADISVGHHARPYMPHLPALLVGPMLIICAGFSLFLPRRAGLIR